MTIVSTDEFQLSSDSPAIGKTYGELSKEYGIEFIVPALNANEPISASTVVKVGYVRPRGEWDKVRKFVNYALNLDK